ncbi:type II secretion system protein|uniref:Prepilin-type N-terminal cleavage/methylation domain-containing protein n=1 Tax=Dendrosporobacter quercicolus TaxID=146817 RepID=A0A1G9M8E4_9FIRM|nr:type II secretion system protein [Dendrosporobacter quercicolus]NSL46959.1 type II secretion system protein [Dendrosporobacter quercicolus DSM 1736]SDL70550.1 prepilin-type N-terminal cleavage/methylation domain-containing protein [Dendrosporobacter quercicolus]
MLQIRSQKGFTLIELLVVIALLTIIAAIAIINVSHVVARNDLQTATVRLLADVRTMQQLSMEKRREDDADKVNITFSGNSYQIITNKTARTAFPARTLPPGITVSFSGGNTLSFDAVDLAKNTNAMITLTSASLPANKTRTLVIARETGRIRVDSSARPSYLTEESSN